jgi:hypothetical protein
MARKATEAACWRTWDMELIRWLRLRRTATLVLTLTVATLVAACSSASPTFTPEQERWGVGCRGPNADIYCHYGGK